MGPLKRSKAGNINIVVICDQKTKYAWFRATRNQEAIVLAPILVKIQMEFGIFEQILSDQGRNYESHLIAQMSELMDINKKRTTPFHAMGDGLSERQNQSLIKMIKTNINDDHSNWDEILPQLQYAYNVSTHATTGVSPFYMIFGREPKCPLDLMIKKPEVDLPTTNEEYIINLRDNFRKAFEIAAKNTEIKVELSRIQYNRTSFACMFEPGQKVWVRDFKPDPSLCRKFCNAWKGPFTVIQRIDEAIYKLKPDKAKGRTITMHRNNLKSYTPRIVAELTMDDDKVKITAENKVTKSEKPKRQTDKPMKQIAKASLIEEVAEPKQMRLRPRTATKAKPTETTNKPIVQQPKATSSYTPVQLDNNPTPKRRGRPKKNSSINNHINVPKRPKGRPPKQATTVKRKAHTKTTKRLQLRHRPSVKAQPRRAKQRQPM
jgi:hypothetical protein